MSEASFPPPIGGWTLETVKRIVRDYPKESDWFDYKEALVPHKDQPPDKKGEHRGSIRRCACAMSNTNGGFIIFGVKDAKNSKTGYPEIVGIDLKGDLRKQFGDLLDEIDPNIRGFDAKTIPFDTDESGEGVWVVQLPVSPFRPHASEGRFYKRVPAGKCEPMSASEVREIVVHVEQQRRSKEMLLSEIAMMAFSVVNMKSHIDNAVGIGDRLNIDGASILVRDAWHLIRDDHASDFLLLCQQGRRINMQLDRVWHAALARAVNPQASLVFDTSEFSQSLDAFMETARLCCQAWGVDLTRALSKSSANDLEGGAK